MLSLGRIVVGLFWLILQNIGIDDKNASGEKASAGTLGKVSLTSLFTLYCSLKA